MSNQLNKAPDNTTAKPPARKGPACYGSRYWCIKTALSPDGEIYVWANEIKVENGALICTGTYGSSMDDFTDTAIQQKPHMNNFVIGAGKWKAFYLASIWDGSAVAIEVWQGEVVRYKD